MSAINFGGEAAKSYVASERGEGNGLLSKDGIFSLNPALPRIFWTQDRQNKSPNAPQIRQMVFNHTVACVDTGDEGVPLSNYQDLDGVIKGTNPPKARAIQTIGNYLRDHGYAEAEIQAQLAKLPGLPAGKDQAAEEKFCKALFGMVEGRKSYAFCKRQSKADGSKFMTIIEKMVSQRDFDVASKNGNGFRLDYDEAALEAERKAKAAMGKKRGGGRPGAGGAAGAAGAVGQIPVPATDLNLQVS